MLQAGTLRHLVDVEQCTITASASGARTESWASLGERYADIQPLTGREYFLAQQVQSTVTHKVTMRYDPQITMTSKLRLTWGSRTFNIGMIMNEAERNEKLTLMCTEVT